MAVLPSMPRVIVLLLIVPPHTLSTARTTSTACAAVMLGFVRLKPRSGFYPEGVMGFNSGPNITGKGRHGLEIKLGLA
jgi:hypothetical protein